MQQLYILILTIQHGSVYTTTASQAYSAGDYLLYDWTLYKVTASIASGGSIITTGGSANVSATTIGTELTSQNSHIANLGSGKVANDVVSAQDVETFGGAASRQIAAKTYFLCTNGKRYKASTTINQGTTITVNNAAEVPIDLDIASINNKSLKCGTIDAQSGTDITSYTSPTAINDLYAEVILRFYKGGWALNVPWNLANGGSGTFVLMTNAGGLLSIDIQYNSTTRKFTISLNAGLSTGAGWDYLSIEGIYFG